MNYIHPVANKISQKFGANAAWYRANVGQNGHNGIDYACPIGTPVRATASGTIDFEGYGQNLGLAGKVAGIYCLIKHSKGYSGYAHLSRTIVNKGQKVKQGQVIGYSGATGLVTGPHLHFETLPLSYNINNGYYGRVNPSTYKLGVKEAAKPKPLIATVVTPQGAYVRDKPTTAAPLSGSRYLPKGSTFVYKRKVKGQRIRKGVRWIDTWYESQFGNYVWAGNLKG